MHIAGEKLIKSGFKYVIPLEGGKGANTFARLYNNGRLLPDFLNVAGKRVRITIQDGDLPGLGIYVYCRHEKTVKIIEGDIARHALKQEPDLIDPHYEYET